MISVDTFPSNVACDQSLDLVCMRTSRVLFSKYKLDNVSYR